MSRVAASILELVSQTPTVALSRVISRGASVHLKLELLSPTASLKDRVAVAAVAEALAGGVLQDGGLLVEPSLGNTAVSLAFACASRRISLTAVLPDSASLERRALLRAYRAKVVLTPAEGGLSGAIAHARALRAQAPGAVTLGLYDGRVALEVHARQTAQELLETVRADGGAVGGFVCGVGSGATLAAVGRVLKQAYPALRVVAVEPAASPLLGGGAPRPHRLQELGFDFSPPALARGGVDQVIAVTDAEAWAMKARLGREEGLLVGISTGANVVAALQVAAELGPEARVYTVACDSGEREFSLGEQFA
jgi:cysteine synthase A